MKIRLKTLMAGPEGVFAPESVIEIPPEEARALIAGGYAETISRPAMPPEDEPSAVETAAVEPGSRAMKPAARPRRTP